MSVRDAKAQRIHSENIKRTNIRRISAAASSKPTEKALEHFRIKAYEYGNSQKNNPKS